MYISNSFTQQITSSVFDGVPVTIYSPLDPGDEVGADNGRTDPRAGGRGLVFLHGGGFMAGSPSEKLQAFVKLRCGSGGGGHRGASPRPPILRSKFSSPPRLRWAMSVKSHLPPPPLHKSWIRTRKLVARSWQGYILLHQELHLNDRLGIFLTLHSMCPLFANRWLNFSLVI